MVGLACQDRKRIENDVEQERKGTLQGVREYDFFRGSPSELRVSRVCEGVVPV